MPQEQKNEKPSAPIAHQWTIALGGVIVFVLANVIYARWTGYLLFAVFNPIVLVPILAAAHCLSVIINRKCNWSIRAIGILIWTVPSFYFVVSGYVSSRPERMFEKDVLSPIPNTISNVYGKRVIGIEGYIGYSFSCDSNAVSQIIEARRLVRDTNLVYESPRSQANAPNIEEIANQKIASMAGFLHLPVNYLKEPMLFESHETVGGRSLIQLWVERDQRRAYFFR